MQRLLVVRCAKKPRPGLRPMTQAKSKPDAEATAYGRCCVGARQRQAYQHPRHSRSVHETEAIFSAEAEAKDATLWWQKAPRVKSSESLYWLYACRAILRFVAFLVCEGTKAQYKLSSTSYNKL